MSVTYRLTARLMKQSTAGSKALQGLPLVAELALGRPEPASPVGGSYPTALNGGWR